ncbi:MAG: FadR/GntR family transcriptional regulator [Hespellia sp.]|nr:FadR/GntR family transcriptional regulator [Hespellia sp.]
MNDEVMNPLYKKENVQILRRYLRLTQKEFIRQFLSAEDGKALMSVSTLSNLEAKGGSRINEIIFAVSERLSVDPMIFSMAPEEFAENVGVLFPSTLETETMRSSNGKKGNINQLIYQLTTYFAEQIFAKKLKKGDKIESDRVLATKMGVGRSVIREALKVLDVLGLIDIRPGQGSFISNDESDFFIIPLSWSLFLNGNQTDNIIEVRNQLEIKAAELAAESTDEESRNRLYDVSHKMRNAYQQENFKEFLDDDLEFHTSIAECSQNPVIYSLIQTISNLMRYVSGTGMVNADQLKDIYEEHQKVYGFILAHDKAAAAKAMEEHLEKSKERYRYR